MKKIFLFVFILSANWCTAQIFVNQQNINSSNYQYIEMWEKFNRSTDKFYVMVDYGQYLQTDKKRAQLKLHNKEGGILEFNSVVAILNYFHMNGWELAKMKNTEDIESYLLKRRNDFKLPTIKEQVTSSIESN